MPARPKTSDEDIVTAALALIDQHGVEQLSMNSVATAVGVRGPSLYKRFADKAALLNAVEARLFSELGSVLSKAASRRSGADAVRQLAFAYRSFAKHHKGGYALMFASEAQGEEAVAIRLEAARPVLDLLYGIISDQNLSLRAARAFTAFCHGFVSMEMAGAFRLGGDIEEAFVEGVELLLAGVLARYSNSGSQ